MQEEEAKNQMEAQALELAEEVDLLKKYGPEFEEKIPEMKKWNEKKEMLDGLFNDANVPKIMPGNYINLLTIIKKMVGDTNPAVSQAAVKAIGAIAKGLRKNFESYVKDLMPVLIQKFKEKRPGFADDVFTALDNFMLS